MSDVEFCKYSAAQKEFISDKVSSENEDEINKSLVWNSHVVCRAPRVSCRDSFFFGLKEEKKIKKKYFRNEKKDKLRELKFKHRRAWN